MKKSTTNLHPHKLLEIPLCDKTKSPHRSLLMMK